MKFDSLPEGVVVVKAYPGLKASIVECHHALSSRVEIPAVIGGVKGTAELCRICKADSRVTKGWTLPVKILAAPGDLVTQPEVVDEPVALALF